MRDKLNDSDDAGEDYAQVYIVVRPKAVRGDQVPQINILSSCVCVHSHMRVCAYTYLAPVTQHHAHAHEHMSTYAYTRSSIRRS